MEYQSTCVTSYGGENDFKLGPMRSSLGFSRLPSLSEYVMDDFPSPQLKEDNAGNLMVQLSRLDAPKVTTTADHDILTGFDRALKALHAQNGATRSAVSSAMISSTTTTSLSATSSVDHWTSGNVSYDGRDRVVGREMEGTFLTSTHNPSLAQVPPASFHPSSAAIDIRRNLAETYRPTHNPSLAKMEDGMGPSENGIYPITGGLPTNNWEPVPGSLPVYGINGLVTPPDAENEEATKISTQQRRLENGVATTPPRDLVCPQKASMPVWPSPGRVTPEMTTSGRRSANHQIPSSSSSSSLQRRMADTTEMDDAERRKLELKRAKNREAAQRCQLRKQERISRLEGKVGKLREQNGFLVQTVTGLRDEIVWLQRQLTAHSNSGCQIALPRFLVD